MRTRITLSAAVVLLAGIIAPVLLDRGAAHGQSSAAPASPARDAISYSPFGRRLRSNQFVWRNKLNSAIKTLRSAKDAAAKDKATKAISALLNKQFDTDLKRREKEIADIEARTKELRSVLDKRRNAKASIIELQIKVLVNEAEGLGFPTGATRSRAYREITIKGAY